MPAGMPSDQYFGDFAGAGQLRIGLRKDPGQAFVGDTEAGLTRIPLGTIDLVEDRGRQSRGQPDGQHDFTIGALVIDFRRMRHGRHQRHGAGL